MLDFKNGKRGDSEDLKAYRHRLRSRMHWLRQAIPKADPVRALRLHRELNEIRRTMIVLDAERHH